MEGLILWGRLLSMVSPGLLAFILSRRFWKAASDSSIFTLGHNGEKRCRVASNSQAPQGLALRGSQTPAALSKGLSCAGEGVRQRTGWTAAAWAWVVLARWV